MNRRDPLDDALPILLDSSALPGPSGLATPASSTFAKPKYSLAEVERRWLIRLPCLAAFDGKPSRLVEDIYISQTLMRLRKVSDPENGVTYKLCKKYGRTTTLTNPITNIYLSEDEYRVLATLKGLRVCKLRYSIGDGVVDIYPGPPQLAIFEIEFPSERAADFYVPPHFVDEEITDNPAYSGAALAARLARPIKN